MRRDTSSIGRNVPRRAAPLWIGSALLLWACGDEAKPEPGDAGIGGPLDAGPEPAAPPDAATAPEPAPRGICSGDGWCWSGLGLHNAALHAIAGDGPNDLWAVGELGLTLHFDGERWDARWAPERHALRALSAQGGEVWAAGDEATLLHLVNQEWRPEALSGLPAGARLRGVWADADGRVVVVGDSGLLRERNAGVWSSVELAGGATLNAVWSNGSDVWAVGALGMVLRKNADGWARVDAGTAQDLTSVAGSGAEVWIAGANGEIRRYELEQDVWARPEGEGPAPSGQLRALQVGPARVFVADERGHLFVWDTTTTCPVPGDAGAPEAPCPRWLDVRSTPGEFPIAGAWLSDDGPNGATALAVGASGSITRWDGDVRSSLGAGSRDNYLDISGSSDTDVWVAGDGLLHSGPDGRWQEVEKTSPRAIYAVQSLAERTLFAGTGGLARGYAGDAWIDMDVRADAWLRALWGDASSAWLVGARGASFGLLNGRLWTPLATPTDRDLLAVYGVPAGSVWAVGAGGVVLRHDGAQWAAIPSGADGGVADDLRGVWGSAEDDVWAVGTGGTALHWDGRVWTRDGEAAAYSLNAVWGRSKGDVWAAGSGGTLLHYDGLAWHAEFSGTSQALTALWGSSRRLWAVGENGTVLVKELLVKELPMKGLD